MNKPSIENDMVGGGVGNLHLEIESDTKLFTDQGFLTLIELDSQWIAQYGRIPPLPDRNHHLPNWVSDVNSLVFLHI